MPSLTYGYKLQVVTVCVRLGIQVAKMGLICRVAGFSPLDRVWSSAIQEDLKVEPLPVHIKRSQLRWFEHLIRRTPGHLSLEVLQTHSPGRRPRGRPRIH